MALIAALKHGDDGHGQAKGRGLVSIATGG